MNPQLKEHITAKDTWIRGVFMLLFAFFMSVAKLVAGVVVVMQFLFTVFTGETNDNLKQFGLSLSRYMFQAMVYLTYNSEEKPFPFNPWPMEEEQAVAPPQDEVAGD